MRLVFSIITQVQAVGGFGIQVSGIIGADESTPLGVIVAGVQVIQPGLPVVVIAPIADGVAFSQVGACAVGNGTIAPGIMYILPLSSPTVKKMPHPGGCGIVCSPMQRALRLLSGFASATHKGQGGLSLNKSSI